MKIILVVTNSKRKSLVFISDKLQAYSLDEAIQLTLKNNIEETHVAHKDERPYLRTNPSVPKKE